MPLCMPRHCCSQRHEGAVSCCLPLCLKLSLQSMHRDATPLQMDSHQQSPADVDAEEMLDFHHTGHLMTLTTRRELTGALVAPEAAQGGRSLGALQQPPVSAVHDPGMPLECSSIRHNADDQAYPSCNAMPSCAALALVLNSAPGTIPDLQPGNTMQVALS